jgi:hypothetical protein
LEDSSNYLSLSDDQWPEDMRRWTNSPKKQASKGGSRDHKHREPIKPSTTARNPNPGIDITLRNLHHEVCSALRMFQALVQCFEHETKSLQSWAEEHTLDTVWRNKVKEQCRDKRERARFEGAAARLAGSRAALKNAIKLAKALRETWDDRHGIELQIWTAKKALVCAEWIVGLAERAASERLACRQLVTELEEARELLDSRRHPWICKSSPVCHLCQGPRTLEGGRAMTEHMA